MKILKYLGIKPKPKTKKEATTLSDKYLSEVWKRNSNLSNLKKLIK